MGYWTLTEIKPRPSDRLGSRRFVLLILKGLRAGEEALAAMPDMQNGGVNVDRACQSAQHLVGIICAGFSFNHPHTNAPDQTRATTLNAWKDFKHSCHAASRRDRHYADNFLLELQGARENHMGTLSWLQGARSAVPSKPRCSPDVFCCDGNFDAPCAGNFSTGSALVWDINSR